MAFTYFFRDRHTLELIVKHVIPHVRGRSSIRIWDAGCAMGQEPYTILIMCAENMGRFAFRNMHVYATDVDGSNLFENIIINGSYPEKELQRIPGELFKKYFQSSGEAGHFRIIDSIRSRISYRRHDLRSLEPVGDGFSLVVCKNVLLHLQPSERVKVIRMFHDSLAPGGFFVTEQTQKLPDEAAHLFTQVAADAQLFQKAG